MINYQNVCLFFCSLLVYCLIHSGFSLLFIVSYICSSAYGMFHLIFYILLVLFISPILRQFFCLPYPTFALLFILSYICFFAYPLLHLLFCLLYPTFAVLSVLSNRPICSLFILSYICSFFYRIQHLHLIQWIWSDGVIVIFFSVGNAFKRRCINAQH